MLVNDNRQSCLPAYNAKQSNKESAMPEEGSKDCLILCVVIFNLYVASQGLEPEDEQPSDVW